MSSCLYSHKSPLVRSGTAMFCKVETPFLSVCLTLFRLVQVTERDGSVRKWETSCNMWDSWIICSTARLELTFDSVELLLLRPKDINNRGEQRTTTHAVTEKSPTFISDFHWHMKTHATCACAENTVNPSRERSSSVLGTTRDLQVQRGF